MFFDEALNRSEGAGDISVFESVDYVSNRWGVVLGGGKEGEIFDLEGFWIDRDF